MLLCLPRRHRSDDVSSSPTVKKHASARSSRTRRRSRCSCPPKEASSRFRVRSPACSVTTRELVEKKPLAELVIEQDRPGLGVVAPSSPGSEQRQRPRDCRAPGSYVTMATAGAVRAHDREPARGPDRRRVRHLRARHHGPFDRRAPAPPCALASSPRPWTSTADGILVVDRGGRITSFNRRFAEMWRLPESLLEIGDDSAVLTFVPTSSRSPRSSSPRSRSSTRSRKRKADTIEFKDGGVLERHSRPQRVDGAVVGRVWSFRDATDRKRLEEELSYQAFHDSLTGLANKALFQDRLQHAAARIERTRGTPRRALHRLGQLQDGERQPRSRRR